MVNLDLTDIKIVYVEAVLMPNNEVLHLGKSLGYISNEQRRLVNAGVNKTSEDNIEVVELKIKN